MIDHPELSLTLMPAWQVSKLNPVHDRLIDLVLAHPDATYQQLGQALGYSKVWVQLMMNSDAFRAKLQQASGELSASFREDIQTQLRVTANKALERIQTVLEVETDLEKLNETASVVLDSLGLGPSKKLPGIAPQQIGTVNIQQNIVPESVFARARNSIGHGRQSLLPQASPAVGTEPADLTESAGALSGSADPSVVDGTFFDSEASNAIRAACG